MKLLRNISLLIVPLLMLASYSNGKSVTKRNRIHLKNTSVGFYRGVTILDVSKGGSHSSGGKHYMPAANSGFSVGFPIVNQFKAEVGLSMSNVLLNNNSNTVNNSLLLKKNNNMVAIPLSVQYYLLPKKSKIQPYFGFGAMIVPDADKYLFVRNSDGIKLLNGLSTINLLITQGVNIEINTKIHLTESVHIISSEGKTNFGVNFGVNFYVP